MDTTTLADYIPNTLGHLAELHAATQQYEQALTEAQQALTAAQRAEQEYIARILYHDKILTSTVLDSMGYDTRIPKDIKQAALG